METIVSLLGGVITIAVALWWLWRCHKADKAPDEPETKIGPGNDGGSGGNPR